MKKGLLIVLASLLAQLFFTLNVPAQTTQPSTDGKMEELKKEEAELDRLIAIKELEKRNKEKRTRLNQLNQELSETQTTPPSSPQVNTNTSSGSSTPVTSVATIGGTAVTSTVSAPLQQTATAGQASTKCNVDLNTLSVVDQGICTLARDIVDRRIAGLTPRGIDLTADEASLFIAVFGQVARKSIVDAALKSFVLDMEASRADKQLGADPKSSGTTSLAVKGGIPTVLSWAVENGAAVASRDGTTVTFRINPVGAIQALSGAGYISGFTETENDPVASFFRRTSLGFSFDTTRGTDPPTLIGSKQQLSAVSFRYQFVNQRDPRLQRYRKLWDQFFAQQGIAFTKQQSEMLQRLEADSKNVEVTLRNSDLQRWLDETNTALARTTIAAAETNKLAAIDEVRAILEQRLEALPVTELEKDTALIDALSGFVGAYLPFIEKKKEILDEIAKGTLVTFEYTNFREVNAPDLSNFRFIVEKGMLGGIDITANASLTFYNKRPVGQDVKRLRDFSFTAQLDKKLKDVMGLGDSTLSFAGKFERVTSNAVALDGTVLPNTKGDIAAGQIKLTIPLKDTGIKIPFSVTFANRTELVREREVRGNFGFTLDFDTLFARFKSFTR